MKYYTYILLAILALSQCKGSENQEKTKTDFAKEFAILEQTNDKTVIRDSLKRKLTIYNKGEIPKKNSLTSFKSPVKRVIAGTSPVAALLKPLGELKSIKGVTVPAKDWFIPEIKKGLEAGNIKFLGYGMSGLNFEVIVKLAPDVFFTTSDYDQSRCALLEKRNIKPAIVHEYREETYMGQFEWIKMLAAFYNKGELAQQVFEKIRKAYFKVKQKAQSSGKPVKVAWGSIYNGKASSPGGNSYVAKALEDAGGDYVMKDFKGSGSLPVSLEKFYYSAKDADVFIYSSTKEYGASSIKKLIASNNILGKLKSFKTGNVWSYKTIYWQSVDKPSQILEDIAAIIHPELFPGHKLRFFEKVPLN